MNLRGLMKNAPNTVLVICGTMIALAILASLVFLANAGKDSSAVKDFVQILVGLATLVVGGTAAVSAGSAARTSGEAKDAAEQAVSQTNGQLDRRIQNAIQTALQRQVDGDVPPRTPGPGEDPLI